MCCTGVFAEEHFWLHRRRARAILTFQQCMLVPCPMGAAISKPLQTHRFYKQTLHVGRVWLFMLQMLVFGVDHWESDFAALA